MDHDQKHKKAETDQMKDEQEPEGSMPATGSDEAEESTLEEAHEVGLYEDQDEEHPGELNIAKEVEKDEKQRR